MKQAALIGLGMVSGTYANAIRKSDKVALKYIHARSSASMDAFLARNPDLGATPADLAMIARDPDLDFAILVTPPNARQEFVDLLSSAGKPILMEKPVERTYRQAKELVELCENRQVPLGIVLQHRTRSVVQTLREHLPRLGLLRLVEVSVPWWRPQSYYDVAGRGTFARDGGGVLISQAIHTLDLMLSLCGPVKTVSAMASTTGFHRMEAEDTVTAGLQFENGATGTFFATTASFPGKGETITIHSDKGSAHLDAGTLTITLQNGETLQFGTAKSSGAGADPMAFTSDWHQAVIEDFADALVENRTPLITGRDALAVHKFIDILERSAREGRHLSFD